MTGCSGNRSGICPTCSTPTARNGGCTWTVSWPLGRSPSPGTRSPGTPAGLERLLTEFLRWRPQPITAVGALVRAVAPLTRLLRGEVLEQLAAERKAVAAGSLT